ncbi:MAG: sugar-binding domain-containing protein, partial [Bryobacteraceae bacterium]
QGIGEPGPSRPTHIEQYVIPMRHRFTGSVWCRRSFRVPPEWKGKQVWLKIGGVNSQGWFWVNDHYVGTLDSFCGSFKFLLNPFLAEGSNTIVVRVSNKVISRKGLMNWLHQFGGLYRSVELEATAPVRIEDVWAKSDFDNRRANFQVTLMAPPFQNISGDYRVTVRVSTPDGRSAGQAELPVSKIEDTGTQINIPVTLDPFRPWSPETPNLYRVDVTLTHGGQAIDGWAERFGVRKLERRGPDIYLNNRRYFLRGFGDDYVYPLTIASPASREEHRKHLEIARSYGFNYVRLHTHVEVPEYFEAAEEAGIMIQAEMPYEGSRPATFGVTEPGIYAPLDYLHELVRHYRRYTSLATYSLGNEGMHALEVREPLYQLAKILDPSRFVMHQDGVDTLSNPSSRAIRANYEGISDLRGGAINVPLAPEETQGSMPVILHEYLNLSGPPDPRLEPLFTGAQVPPYNLKEEKDNAEKIGIGWKLAERCIQGGHEMQSVFQKLGLEHARALPELDGYDYWTLVDVNALVPQGLLDMFWQPKRSRPAYFRQFNGPTVLLLPDLAFDGTDRVYTAGTRVSQRVACSNYSEQAIGATRVLWTLSTDGRTVAQGRLENVQIAQGTVSQLGKIEFVTPRVNHPTAAVLRVEIEGKGVENEWKFYIFPDASSRSELQKVSATDEVRRKLSTAYPSLGVVSAQPGPSDVLITEQLDADALRYLQSGARVVLVSLSGFSPVQPGLRLGWWWSGNQRGTALAESRVYGDFPVEEGMPFFALRRIFRETMLLDSKWQNRVDPLLVTLGKDGYLLSVFQTKVGSGKLLASGLDLLSDKPEARHLLDQFVRYAQSVQFDPQTEMPLAELKRIAGGASNP